MHGVAEGHVDKAAEAEESGVVVHDVELIGPTNRGEKAPHLPERVTDPLARSGVKRTRASSAVCELARTRASSPRAPSVDEAVGEQRDDALDPTYASGGTGNHTGR